MSMEKNFSPDIAHMFAKAKKKIDSLYEKVTVGDVECYRNGNNVFFRLYAFKDRDALCIEYADNAEGATKGIFGEDGELFYLDEYETDEALISDILAEINEAV